MDNTERLFKGAKGEGKSFTTVPIDIEDENPDFSDWNLIELVALTFKRHLLNVEENIALDRELKKRSEPHTKRALTRVCICKLKENWKH